MTVATALLSADITKPGYLIEVSFDPVRYYSTRGIQSYGGNTWIPGSGWIYDSGALKITGGDPVITRLILSQGVVGRRVRVWLFYTENATDTTTELLFDGYADGAPSLVDPITLPLFEQSAAMLYAPRRRIRPETGFHVLPQAGLKVKWGTVTIKLNE